MKRLVLFFLLTYSLNGFGQSGSTFLVHGDVDKFYPVVFQDANWINNRATEIEIGRSDVHMDENWRGSLMARFRFHATRWGNAASFVDADVIQRYNKYSVQDVPFVAGYRDATGSNATFDFIIWLRGATTYHYFSNSQQSPVVYDGNQHALPFQEVNGPVHSFKTAVDPYLNNFGKSSTASIYAEGNGLNYMNGDLGLGTRDTKGFKLVVNGKIRTQEVRVEADNWPDYVFDPEYKITPLQRIKTFIIKNKHLPEIPSASDIRQNGLELGEMNKLLLKKIEELTLHLIEKDEQVQALHHAILKLPELERQIKELTKNINIPKP
ncbi:hypothetical protein QWY86_15630 [Pedobacter aquatilis]|uniref:hypothetical protein n=1 Tax=Pedobacter aquatilis TaxID=351343 RepID=UPI0025B2C031|nr:hypothetical protein [Pedobacter aquatilis]MDN3588114.1 hypothetical protein [Pedobacter aquatilis]